jgi:hypothetical protein
MTDFGERFSGKADERNNDLWGDIHIEPGVDNGRIGDGPGTGEERLTKILVEFIGVDGSKIPPLRDSKSDAELVEADSLIGDPRSGPKANAWVDEALIDGKSPADRINRACALVWLGAARWRNYEQDAANAYWSTARAILAGSGWEKFETKAARLSELIRGLPE